MHERKRMRLKGFDYSTPGTYFVTICTKNRLNIFGKIWDRKMLLNENGKILEFCWKDLMNHYLNIKLDEYIIMPNHFHGIVWIVDLELPSWSTRNHPWPKNILIPVNK